MAREPGLGTRRQFLALAAAAVGLEWSQRSRGGTSRLSARTGRVTGTLAPGEHSLDGARDRALGAARGNGVIRIPKKYREDTPAPLALLLHGAGGRARGITSRLGIADSLGIVMLVPESRDSTWDAIRGDFGEDVAFVNRALEFAFSRVNVDPARLAIGGFSDGASYALSLGLDNGDLFSHILAFSPGFIASQDPQGGRPRIFVSHGTADDILPFATTSSRLVPALERAGYSVNFRRFGEGHTVPPSIAHEAFTWFLQTPRPPRA